MLANVIEPVQTLNIPDAGTETEYHILFTEPPLQQLPAAKGASSVAQELSSLIVTPEVSGIAPPHTSFAAFAPPVVNEKSWTSCS